MDIGVLYIWISLINGIGNVKINALVKELGGIERVYKASRIQLGRVKGMGEKSVEFIVNNKSLTRAKIIKNYCVRNGIQIICREDKNYIKALKEFKDAPALLYVYGDLKNLDKGIAIVGSRRCDAYGRGITMEFGKALSENNIPVISGMSDGIEAFIQSYCIKYGGYPVCILGTGIDGCYPSGMGKLKNAIGEKGVLISQFPIGTKPIKENFLKRNKLIAMISKKILVVEATRHSGALIIAKYGFEMNKEVFTVPGNIKNELTEGNNLLIKKGAKLYLSPSSMVRQKRKPTNLLNAIEEKILKLIKEKPKSIDELNLLLKMDNEFITEKIFNLELNEQIQCKNGKYEMSY